MPSVDELLSNSEPWLHYAIRLNLLSEKKEDLEFSKTIMLQDPRIKQLLADVADYHGMLVSGHKNAALPIHKLLFLLDLGLDDSVVEIKHAIGAILSHKDQSGVYQSKVIIPKQYGGNDAAAFVWSLCDAPLLLMALCKAGVDYPSHIEQGVKYLLSFKNENGFPCVSSSELGKWRGPGKKEDCCPYATLIMLKLMNEIPAYEANPLRLETAQNLLDLWENSMQTHPYMFFMGTDFRKLKAPMLWYDIVSMSDALSKVKGVIDDPLFIDMIDILHAKQNAKGSFTPESVYLKFNAWDFGQKNIPSPYLTYLIQRIFQEVTR
jgi:hypothetical protein